MADEFKELHAEAALADDVIISNLLAKQGIKRKTIHVDECCAEKIKQYEYGFGADALHNQTQGGHHENYNRILKNLEDKGKNYFNYKCS